MTSEGDFLNAWKARFPTSKPPDLECFQATNLENGLNLDLVRQEKRKFEEALQSLKNELYKHEFIVGFLWELDHKSPEVDKMSDKKDRVSKQGPPTAPKQTAKSTQSNNNRVDPDFDLDCEVPVEQHHHVKHRHGSGDKELEQVPAYMETDLDSFALKYTKGKASRLSEISDPGYLPGNSVVEGLRPMRSTETDQSSHTNDCKSLDSALDASNEEDEKRLPSLKKLDNSEEKDDANRLWTRGVNLEKVQTNSSVTQNDSPKLSHSSEQNVKTSDVDIDKNKLTRMLSADSNKPSSYAEHRRDLFGNQRKSCSFNSGGSGFVEVNKPNQIATPPKSAAFSTFKPKVQTPSSASPDSDRKSKPVPAPRVSIGPPEFKVREKTETIMFNTTGDDGLPIVENETKSLDFPGENIPPGMCKIAPPEVLRAAALNMNSDKPATSQPASIHNMNNSGSVKKEKPQRPQKPSMKVRQDYMNFEIGSIKPPEPAQTGPPIMVVKPISSSKSPQITRTMSENSPTPSRSAPPPPTIPRPATMSLVTPEVTAPKPRDGPRKDHPRAEVIYEDPTVTQDRDKVDEVSSSDEDEPVYQNLLLLQQQSLSRGHSKSGAGMFASMDLQKRYLHKKAERLSRRFSSLDVTAGGNTTSLSRYAGTDQLLSIGEQDATDGKKVRSKSPSQPEGSESPAWRKRQSMLFATGDDNTSEDDLDVVVPTCAETEKIHMRKYLVTSIVASERMYLLTLDTLMQYMQTFKNVQNTPQSVISPEDIAVIFCKIPELHRIHFDFIKNLEPKLENWTGEGEIAENFKILALEECPLATEYLKNYQKAVSTIHRCTTDNPQFSELTQNIKCKGSTSAETSSLEELLHKPVVRFQRNTLVLHDLIKFTLTSHPDYDPLQKTRKIAQNFLENFETPVDKNNAENQRYLSKQGLVVEKVGSGNQRKLRRIFLFNDVLICCKQKLSRQRIVYDIKWAIALPDLIMIEDRMIAQEERLLIENTKQEADKLQRRVSELQNELKQEMKKAKLASDGQRSWSFRGHKGNLEKIKKKLCEQESQLMLAAPHLILKVKSGKTEKSYSLLLASDYERIGWKETITGLQTKNIIPRPTSIVDLNALVNSLKLPKLMSTGSMDINDFELEDEALFGSLDATVHKLYGLKVPCDVYCCMEVDTFGHFCMKAKTNMIAGSTEPTWNENFDIELDGAQQLRVLVYKRGGETDSLIGKCALELCKGWLRGDFSEETISIGDSMTLVLSLKYSNREQTIKRTPSSVQGGLFGVKISTVAKREGTKVPMLVSTCAQEVERRGIEDVGIYRISGLNAEIQRLKRGFEKCKTPATASMIVKDMDINVVAGLLKLYFRELPESLFTDKLYYRFHEGMMLSDPEAKEKFMMTIFKSLPEPNNSTAVFMLDHLVRVSKHEAKNKMSMHNLSTVFGPTLLRPATKESEPVSMEQLFTAGARDAMMQTGILFFYLSNWHNRDMTQHNTRL